MDNDFWTENQSVGVQMAENAFSGYGSESLQETLSGQNVLRQTITAEDWDKQIQHDLQSLAETVQGRRFLKFLLETAGVFEAMPVGNKEMYAYCEGKRSMGLMLYHRLYAINPQYIINIQGEF